jgi:hypothetical protein
MKKAECEKISELHVVFTVEPEMKTSYRTSVATKARNFQWQLKVMNVILLPV